MSVQVRRFPRGRIPIPVTCPKCGETIDGFTALEDRPELRDGDMSICIYCATILRIAVNAERVTLHEATPEEFLDMTAAQRGLLKRAQRYILKRLESEGQR